jgi:hypothetical protein
MAATKQKVGRVRAINACAITVGARPPVYETAIVRDNHTGKLAEVELNPERPPIDEGDLGRFYVFSRGEEISADHEAALDAPGCFEPVEN